MRVLRGLPGFLSCIAVLLTATGASAQHVKQVTDAYNASGQVLFEQFAAEPGNIVFSPYSIGTAMAMVLSGARGQTEAEMAKVLKQTLPRPAIERANGRVLATLKGYDKSAVLPTCPTSMKLDGTMCKGPPQTDGGCLYPMALEGAQCIDPATLAPSAKLSVANALMLTKFGDLVSPGYAALLKAKYGAEIFKNAGLADVNAWVERKTEGKIDKILEELDDNSAAVLLNAVYFKAAWEFAFVKFVTYDGAFWLTPSQQADVPTMHQYGRFAVVSHPGFRAIRLPYVVRSVGLIVVLPEKIDGVGEIGKRFGGAELPQLLAELRSARHKKVDLSLPRFKASFKADLVPSFKTAGMQMAFDPKRADFSGISGRPPSKGPLVISQIAHRAVIEVDEEGTVASAATVAELAFKSEPIFDVSFRVDRPFLFYLVDDKTGAILFQGRISDPR